MKRTATITISEEDDKIFLKADINPKLEGHIKWEEEYVAGIAATAMKFLNDIGSGEAKRREQRERRIKQFLWVSTIAYWFVAVPVLVFKIFGG